MPRSRCATSSTRAGPASWPGTQQPRRQPDVAYDVAVYLHLLSLFGLVGAITMAGLCYFRLRAAESFGEAAQWARLAERVGWAFPVAILGLVASGAYLTTERWSW